MPTDDIRSGLPTQGTPGDINHTRRARAKVYHTLDSPLIAQRTHSRVKEAARILLGRKTILSRFQSATLLTCPLPLLSPLIQIEGAPKGGKTARAVVRLLIATTPRCSSSAFATSPIKRQSSPMQPPTTVAEHACHIINNKYSYVNFD